MDVKDLVRPPFANYDVVVYFGCGLFALPLINHYAIEPSDFRFPRFAFDIGIGFANQAVTVLSILFTVYILGHAIAYASSLLIEKYIDSFFGKVSSAILISSYVRMRPNLEIVSAWQFDRLKVAFRPRRRWANALRLIAHVPVFPLYLFAQLMGGFDYYRTRIPHKMLFLAQRKVKALKYGQISLRSSWYKPLEYDVINNNPAATGRMYNYLVISGLFRSVAFLMLAAIWCEVYYWFHWKMDGHDLLKPLMSDVQSIGTHLLSFLLLFLAYGVAFSSYMKFQRRYAEEAIFAFVLAKD